MTTSASARIHWENGMMRPLRISRQFSPLFRISTVCPCDGVEV